MHPPPLPIHMQLELRMQPLRPFRPFIVEQSEGCGRSSLYARAAPAQAASARAAARSRNVPHLPP